MTERVARLALCIETGSEADAEELAELAVQWVSHRGGRSVKLGLDGDVLEINGITREDQRELIHAWIDRHTDR
jgi:hypothetical protein